MYPQLGAGHNKFDLRVYRMGGGGKTNSGLCIQYHILLAKLLWLSSQTDSQCKQSSYKMFTQFQTILE